jgi:hypothetical protein
MARLLTHGSTKFTLVNCPKLCSVSTHGRCAAVYE